ncbi:MAG: FAD-binding oxidoreductase, partial [Clostridia bacterium]|nr:FAD-binding oxidoreductase [Clostridia bacterium]
MAYKFKKQLFGFMDLLRFKKHVVPDRQAALAAGSSDPLPTEYAVNNTAKILHPGCQTAVLKAISKETPDTTTYTFETSLPFYFRAGQYLTLGCRIGTSNVSRPYAISSSPKEGLQRKLSLTVKRSGFFSGWLADNAKVGDVFT